MSAIYIIGCIYSTDSSLRRFEMGGCSSVVYQNGGTARFFFWDREVL